MEKPLLCPQQYKAAWSGGRPNLANKATQANMTARANIYVFSPTQCDCLGQYSAIFVAFRRQERSGRELLCQDIGSY